MRTLCLGGTFVAAALAFAAVATWAAVPGEEREVSEWGDVGKNSPDWTPATQTDCIPNGQPSGPNCTGCCGFCANGFCGGCRAVGMGCLPSTIPCCGSAWCVSNRCCLNEGSACATASDCCQFGEPTLCCLSRCTSSSCYDGNPCTADPPLDCATGQCVHDPMPDSTLCDDGNFCTVNDHCVAGVCGGGAPRVCPDAPCRAGVCDEIHDLCSTDGPPINEGQPCPDPFYCTVSEHCAGGSCGGRLPCDDGDPG